VAGFHSVQIFLQNISKSFDNVKALDAVSFEVNDGECFFLLGPSGCGKTTALRIIAGFCRPDSGQLLFDNRPMNAVAPNLRNTSMVFQNYALWPHLTVEENIAFGLTVPAHRVPKAERAQRVKEMISLLHLNGTENRRPGQISGGQQQRTALARALIIKPACLLLDEPLSNLDAKLRAEMRLELRHIIKKMGVTAVYVTHDQAEALSMADRCAIMREGRIEQIGTPHELYELPANRFVADFMGCANLLESTVLSIEQDIVRLSNAAGTWFARNANRTFSKGEKVIMALRAEKVRLDTVAGEKANSISARIKETIYCGTFTEYRLELEQGVIIKALQSAALPGNMPPQAQVQVYVDPVDVLVLPAE
jgi:ABC-type Fe3+/spermidine/putrescine transport system ATPase subunit